jgi:Tetratricopeptide repeat
MEKALPGRRDTGRRLCHAALIAALLALVLPFLAGAQTAQEKENRAASLIMQADDLYAEGSYDKAIEIYRQAAAMSASRLNLSRAYMGLSLCYFYLNDTANAKANILKVLEIDPQKEVSSLFHPQTFVDLFEEVKKENAERLGRGQPPLVLEEPPAAEAPAKPGQTPKVTALAGGKSIGPRGGHWEIGVHYSSWGLNVAKGLFEENLLDSVSEEIRENVTDQLNSLSPVRLTPSSDSHGLRFDSEGANYGAEIRYYPRGRRGSMSVGFSIEQTQIKLMTKGPVTQNYSDGSSATVEGDAVVETNPVTTQLSFRWDFIPTSRVTPYFVFGLGLGPLNGNARFAYVGTYVRGSQQAAITGAWAETFDQLRQEEEIALDLMIMAHVAFGFKAEVVRGFILQLETGFWDGLIIRAGLAFRL